MNNDPSQRRAPFAKILGLWQVEGRNGTYLTGRIGDLKIFVMPNRDWVEGSNECTHVVLAVHSPKVRK